jgi:hypothetical protein
VDEIKPVELCGKTVMWEATVQAFELPFETMPTKGEHDFETCKGCQNIIKTLTERLTDVFDGNTAKKAFPFCCAKHSNLVSIKGFTRAAYKNVPKMTALKVVYTNQHIVNRHSSENWYKDITDYIGLTVASFGQMPENCGAELFLRDYLFYVTDLLSKNEEISTERKQRLLDFLNAYDTPPTERKTDLNILMGTYQKWLKTFPFDLNSYFGNLKTKFEKQIHILNGKPEQNIHSGALMVKLHTKSSLIEALIQLTNKLLTEINGATLYEKGLINDANQFKLELAISRRKQKLKQGYVNKSTNEEQRYRKIIKEWFKDEKQFFEQITPWIETKPRKQDNKEKPNTFCPKMPLSIPKEHFKVLTDKMSKNGQPFLTNEQFGLFIERAFCGNTEISKQKINKANSEKLLVQSLFYEFYNNYCMDYFNTMQCQAKFIKLLTDNFEGWDFQNVKNNFTPKTKKRL